MAVTRRAPWGDSSVCVPPNVPCALMALASLAIALSTLLKLFGMLVHLKDGFLQLGSVQKALRD